MLNKLRNLKVKSLKLTGWIKSESLKNIIVCTSKPKVGKYVEVLVEFIPILAKPKKVNRC